MNRWIVNKLGLVNFWYYDVEEFELEDGKLLLRGSNGSGKSVTMQSFVPLLLDGNKAPHRLDPFGSKARKLENYLLDEETDEKTAYLYMEFKRRDTQNYMTLGMGMKAVKNKPMDTWYFVVMDNSRVGKELMLYKQSEGRMALTKKQLENAMAEHGFFTTSQKAYMAKVNEILFGFDTVEQYEELLDLLINVRSPKLSKDFKPTEMYRILTESLKVLTEDDLRPMSEAMENMDTLTGRLAEYEEAKKACKNISYHYNQYNRYCLLDKAQRAITVHEKKDAYEKKFERFKMQQEQTHLDLEQAVQDLQDQENLFEQVTRQYEDLSKEEAFTVERELSERTKDKTDYMRQVAGKEEQIDKKRISEKDVQYKLKEYEGKYEVLQKEVEVQIETLEDYEEVLYLESMGSVGKEIQADFTQYVFKPLHVSLDQHRERLKTARETLVTAEKLREEEARLLETKDRRKVEKETIGRERDRMEEIFLDEKENYKANLYQWQQGVTYFKITQEAIQSLYHKVQQLTEESEIYGIEEDFKDIRRAHEREIEVQIREREQALSKVEEEIQILADEIKVLQEAKEIIPPRNNGKQANRQRLEAADIPYLPLYQAIDFVKDTPDDVRCAIEGAFHEMGLLDALIIAPKDQAAALSFEESQYDKYLFTQSNLMKYNLSMYLTVDRSALGKMDYSAVDDVLTGIFLGVEDGDAIDEKGHYRLGSLRGKYDPQYQCQYIGVSSRKAHRERLIAEKVLLQEGWQQDSQRIQQEIQGFKQILMLLGHEYDARPTLIDLKAGIKSLSDDQAKYDFMASQLLAATEAHLVALNACNAYKNQVFEVFGGLSIPHQLSAIDEALDAIIAYKEALLEIEKLRDHLVSVQQMMDQMGQALEQVREDLDQLYYEMTQLSQRVTSLTNQIIALETTLSAMNLDTLREEIARCLDQKQALPHGIKGLTHRIATLEGDLRRLKQDLEETENLLKQLQGEDLQALEIFGEEYALGYVTQDVEDHALARAYDVQKEYGHLTKKTKEEYLSNLMTSMRDNGAPLREYHLQNRQLFEGTARTRCDLIAKTDGRLLGFGELCDYINHAIEEFGMLISEEERHVFEEVLLNTISSKITSKIYLSKQWVEKINHHMESMQTSSSLRLSLKWLPKKSDAENQMDVSELGELLQRGDRCSADDLKKLARHFADQVQEKIRLYDGTGESRNYHTIIKEVLDYRNWYEFKLYYMKANEKRKELTNNAFFQFSGGEKAMSMYVPLFSAVYARYDSGKSSCPRLVAMDEAFAGVDENNIRDMFRILKDLDLDYILNSQNLWGDYDSVKQLAICEIIREANDQTVLVLRYSWNGIERTLLA